MSAVAVVRAYDPSGVLAGQTAVTLAGWYLVSVYGDDPQTPDVDEGAEPDDPIAFTVDGNPAVPLGPDPPVWSGSDSRLHVELRACTLAGDFDCDCRVTVADPSTGLRAGVAQAQGTIRYVRRYGAVSGDCSTPDDACGSIQYAVDQANDGDEIRIAGYETAYAGQDNPNGSMVRTYWFTELRPAPAGYPGPDQLTQVVYVDQSITLQRIAEDCPFVWRPGV